MDGNAPFSDLLKPFADAVRAIHTPGEVHGALAAIRWVESLAEERRLDLALGQVNRSESDSTLTSTQLAEYLNVTPDWLTRHRMDFRAAEVNLPGARPRYSKNEIDKLRLRRRRF